MTDRLVTTAWRVAAILPLSSICAFLLNGSVDSRLRVMIAAVTVVSVIGPLQGLLLVAVVAPLGGLITILLEPGPVRFTEAAGVALLAGWLLRGGPDRRPGPTPPLPVRYGAWALAGVMVASVLVQALMVRTRRPGSWGILSLDLWRQYYPSTLDAVGALVAFRWLEGLALAATVVILMRRFPILAVRLPEALAVGCFVAGVSTCLLWSGIGLPGAGARQASIGSRVVAHVEDANAAASYYSLMIGIALGMTARERQGKGVWWSVVAMIALVGLWLTRSRAAEGATIVVALLAAWWLSTRRRSPRVRYASLGLLLVTVAAAGVAGGLAWDSESGDVHRYFSQTAVGLGVLGVGAALVAIAGTYWTAARALAAARDDYRLLGLLAGVSAFLLTCSTGRPLLFFETAYPFWLSFGLLLALASPAPPAGRPLHYSLPRAQ